MTLWIDQFEPKSLEDLTCHQNVNETLKSFASSNTLSHLILYGPPGAGKTTRCRALLAALFGDSVHKYHHTTLSIEGTSIEIDFRQSQHHHEVQCGELGLRDKQCVQELVKSMASSGSTMHLLNASKNRPKFKVIVMHEAHLLSVEAQASLRRTLEKYTATARLILIVERLSNIMTPLRSRCYCLRIPAPSLEECETVLRNTCTKANVPMAPPNVIRDIATQSKCNLRRAIIMLQRALVMFDKPPPAVALLPTWVQVVKKVSHEICTQPTKEKFTSARNELLDILTSGIEGQTILETMLVEILSSQKLDEQTALLITQGAAHLVSSHLISDTTRTLGECVPEFKRFCECSRRISSWETAM